MKKTGWCNGLVVQAGVSVASSDDGEKSSGKKGDKKKQLLLSTALLASTAASSGGPASLSGRHTLDGDTAQYLFNFAGAR